jgi:hypothetical protein
MERIDAGMTSVVFLQSMTQKATRERIEGALQGRRFKDAVICVECAFGGTAVQIASLIFPSWVAAWAVVGEKNPLH